MKAEEEKCSRVGQATVRWALAVLVEKTADAADRFYRQGAFRGWFPACENSQKWRDGRLLDDAFRDGKVENCPQIAKIERDGIEFKSILLHRTFEGKQIVGCDLRQQR